LKILKVEDAYKIIKKPYITEKTFDVIEKENKMVFIVDRNSNKRSIKEAIETLYKIKIEAINTVISIDAKRAYVKFSKENSAADLASKLGLV
jgi:large subunit ribosomal protein L23